MALKDTLLRIFTWWSGQTVSVAVDTARNGIFVARTISVTSTTRRRAR